MGTELAIQFHKRLLEPKQKKRLNDPRSTVKKLEAKQGWIENEVKRLEVQVYRRL